MSTSSVAVAEACTPSLPAAAAPPLRRWARSGRRQAAVALGGSLVLAASAWVAIPAGPVPITLQSLAVVLLGALAGGRLAVAAVLAYLAEGAAGLPVFAAGAAGPAVLAGPTGGYLTAFVAAAALCGGAAERGVGGLWGHAAMALAGHLTILIGGAAWLALAVGPGAAVAAGLLPFVGGALAKSAAAAAIATAAAGARRR